MRGLLLLFLAINKKFEPLLLVPIGFGAVLANVPLAEIANYAENGFIGLLYHMGVETGLFPLLIFMGVGAMTDFGPLIANPKTLLLGAAAQFGIFCALQVYMFAALASPRRMSMRLSWPLKWRVRPTR